jgi:hypothetical protein
MFLFFDIQNYISLSAAALTWDNKGIDPDQARMA